MDIERDLARLPEQERILHFSRFDASTAWQIGTRRKAAPLTHLVQHACDTSAS